MYIVLVLTLTFVVRRTVGVIVSCCALGLGVVVSGYSLWDLRTRDGGTKVRRVQARGRARDVIVRVSQR